jgi:hypothetical protein
MTHAKKKPCKATVEEVEDEDNIHAAFPDFPAPTETTTSNTEQKKRYFYFYSLSYFKFTYYICISIVRWGEMEQSDIFIL